MHRLIFLLCLVFATSAAAEAPLPCEGNAAFGLSFGVPSKKSNVKIIREYRAHPDAPLIVELDMSATPWPMFEVDASHTLKSVVIRQVTGWAKLATDEAALALFDSLSRDYEVRTKLKWSEDRSYGAHENSMRYGNLDIRLSVVDHNVFLSCSSAAIDAAGYNELMESK